MNDILNEITKAESQAEEFLKSARNEAEVVIENAKAEIEKKKIQMYEKAKKDVDAAVEEKRTLGMYEADKILKKSEKDIEILASLAEKNKEKAIKKIFSFV